MLGFFVGAVSGAVQFWLLTKFTGPAARAKTKYKTLFFGLSQFLLPFAVLAGSAVLLGESMLWTGVAMASSMIISAIIKYVISSKK